ncbi:hypothetical protein ZWY2020_029426, partial [Hordeum vulgare]
MIGLRARRKYFVSLATFPNKTIYAANLPPEPRCPRPLRRWRQPPALLRSGSSSGRGADGSSENESLPARTFVDLPDLVRVVSIGRKVEDLLANPESKEWLSISTELCGDIFATPFYKIGSTKNTPDAAAIPAARKADVKGNVSKLEEQLREAKKKMGKGNIQKAVKTAIDAAEAAVSKGKPFCVTHADVGLDTTVVREAVVKAMDRFKVALLYVHVSGDFNPRRVMAAREGPRHSCPSSWQKINQEPNNNNWMSSNEKKYADQHHPTTPKTLNMTEGEKVHVGILVNAVVNLVRGGVTDMDLLEAFLSRRIQPLEARDHTMWHYSGLITLVESDPFHDYESETVIAHLTKLHDIATLFTSEEKIRHYYILKLFPFSLKDDAKTWFTSLAPGCVRSPQDMVYYFSEKYFLAHKKQAALQEIYNFAQAGEEKVNSLRRFDESDITFDKPSSLCLAEFDNFV